ncbi:ATPase [Altererythrobacter soli]|uniref:ATPase n=1 Tax=Croceibacterium soli TaxID=1739690 RepID=A0A6I4UUZ2_9SPHN|nr:ATPase [Croceibacterium soli]MXP42366.1 ATPase [Croceibacterium soli]
MSRRENLVAIGSDPEHAAEAAAEPAAPDHAVVEEHASEEAWEDEPEPRHHDWIWPALAIAAALGWTGFFGFAHQREILAGGTPEQWSGWIVAWSVPVLLIVGLWLLVMRNSRREAARFADVARALSIESARLEERLLVINRELSMARDFIAAQSRDLESLGRVAGERISQHAEHLQSLIRDNGEQVETIGRVSTTALENMGRLRSELPVISNSARDVASQIGHAGNTAQGQLAELVTGFRRLNEFGEASERQVAVLRERIDEALDSFEAQAAQLEEIARNRFAALEDRSQAFRADLDGHEVEALAALRRRADRLGEELDARHAEARRQAEEEIALLRERASAAGDEGARAIEVLHSGQEEAARRWAEAVESLKERMNTAIEQISEVDAEALENARRRLAALSEEAERVDRTMSERVEAFEAAIAQRRSQAEQREREALIALEGRLAQLDASVSERQEEQLAHLSGLAERGEALAGRMAALSAEMERIAAQGSEAGGTLDGVTAGLNARLAESRAELDANSHRIARLTNDSVRLLELIRAGAEHSQNDLPQALSQAASDLARFEERVRSAHGLIGEALQQGEELAGHVAAAQRDGAGSIEQFEALERRIAAANRAHAAELAALQAALVEIAGRSEALAQTARGSLGEALESMTERFAEDSATAIEQAMRDHASETIRELEANAKRASGAAREAALQLRDQLAAVNELAGNLEHRVAHARQRAEEQVDNDFARRMALITESLNSSAIDISKAFDNEVSDTAWSSYLRGDRGIFTRRAVRLLDNQASREIAEIYREDSDFRETVNRYIHDFEAMLRSVLSTRDGHALGVTLLSSDPGKLYVALAQAIDRLRT